MCANGHACTQTNISFRGCIYIFSYLVVIKTLHNLKWWVQMLWYYKSWKCSSFCIWALEVLGNVSVPMFICLLFMHKGSSSRYDLSYIRLSSWCMWLCRVFFNIHHWIINTNFSSSNYIHQNENRIYKLYHVDGP